MNLQEYEFARAYLCILPHRRPLISRADNREFLCKRMAATSGDLARPGTHRSITRNDPFALLSECDTRFRIIFSMSVHGNGGEPP